MQHFFKMAKINSSYFLQKLSKIKLQAVFTYQIYMYIQFICKTKNFLSLKNEVELLG